MAFSKIIFNGEILMDVTGDNPASNNMLTGTTATGADGESVNGGIVPKTASDVTVSGPTVTIPAGSYSSQVQKSVASGTEGTPTATKGTVSNHSVTVTPSVTNVAGYISGGTHSGTGVSVTASELASGNKEITSNGTGIDVVGYSTVSVAVPSSSPTLITKSITANGTYNASSDNADGYSSVTVDVSGGGGGGSASPKQINFIDYDGTILYSYTKAEINAMTSESDLPANPSHTGLTAQGWNWTLAQIKAQLTAAPDADVWVGQMYITESGKTEIDVRFPDSARLSPIMTIAVNGTVTVDWGDNTTPDTVTGTSLTTRKEVPHTYASAGDYTIMITVVSGSFTFYGSTSYTLLRKNTTSNENRVYTNTIQAVRLGSGITSVGGNAFYNCYSLASVTIPSGVTSIGNSAFNTCSSLASITIPSGVTSIGSSAFYTCSSLAFVTIPSGVTSIGSSAFSTCSSLASITIPSGVTSIGSSAFYTCYSLAFVTIPSGVTSIGSSAFNTCSSLASITIPSGVTSIESNAFSNCSSLASITIPSGVTSIGSSAFYYCYSLASITIPSGVTSIGTSAFNGCYSLASITIPSGVTSIGDSAFASCYGVKEYHIKPTTVPTAGTTVFNNIVSDCKIYVPSAKLSDYQAASNWSTYASYMQGE